jgi:plasmid stabilization system protein ParE
MKIVISEQADADLDRIFEWIAKDKPSRCSRRDSAHPSAHW